LRFGPVLFPALMAVAVPGQAQGPATAPAAIPSAAAPAQAPAPAVAVSAVPLTLADALKRAIAANPGLGRSRADVNAAQSQVDVAYSSILPKIDFKGNYTRNDRQVSFGSGKDAVTILPYNDWSYRFTLSQPIYAGNRERKAIQQARLSVESFRQGLLNAEDQLILNVTADYLGVLEAEDLLAVEQKNLELAQRRRDQAKVFFEAGETTRVDVLRAEADIKGAERRLASARQTREAAVGRLRLDLALEGPIEVRAPGSLFPARPSEAELVTAAEASRPEVAQALAALESARLEVAKQKNARLPVVTADGAWIKQASAFPTDQYAQLTLNFSVPIFDSGEIKNRVAIAEQRRQQAELTVQEVRQSVREQVHQALVDLQTADANLRLASEQLAAAEAESNQATELYRAEELTSLEAQQAETSLADARRTVANSKLDRDIAELRVWAAAGMLKKTVPLEGVQ
jgi:outer membrane protein